ncbi:thermonuclease family protein [Rhizobium sp. L1K21]|nr:thermonuclease family protein [Rhizobium sp. L1K21]
MILAFSLGLVCPEGAIAEKLRSAQMWVDGPVNAEIVRVLDGDTVEVNAFPWPQQSVTVKVRLRGIDAPEIHSRCEAEKARGLAAKQKLADLLNERTSVKLINISGGKYFGRILADLRLEDGTDASREMLKAGFVQPYEGGKRAKAKCP